MADDYVNQKKFVIQDALEFFDRAEQTQSTSTISYVFLSAEECEESKNDLISKTESLVGVPRAMKILQVVPAEKLSI